MVGILFVLLIALVGLLAGFYAVHEIRQESEILRQGREALKDLSFKQPRQFNYSAWLDERGVRFRDSHFGAHLVTAADASNSGRAISLHELHEVSARREARRISARLAGGVTALLLVCGIAGTLFAIKPVLGEFSLGASPAGVVESAGNAEKATRLIRGLSEAFWPSLVALIATIFVALARGVYAHRRGELACQLDQVDLEELFPRFPAPSLSRELDEIRSRFGDLISQMGTTHSNLNEFVTRLNDAASGFQADAPKLQSASKQFVDASRKLSPKLEALNTNLVNYLEATSSFVAKLDGLAVIGTQVGAATTQLQVTGTVISEHLTKSHDLLNEAVAALPAQLERACQAASTVIANATAGAVASACTAAGIKLDDAAAPLRDAASDIAAAHQGIRADTKQAVDTLSSSVDGRLESTTKLLIHEINQKLESVGEGVETRSRKMEEAFKHALDATVTTVKDLHSSTKKGIARATAIVTRLEEIQREVAMASGESVEVRDDIRRSGDEVTAAAIRIDAAGQLLNSAVQQLSAVQERGTSVIDHLKVLSGEIGPIATLPSEIQRGLEALSRSQRDTAEQTGTLVSRVEQVAVNWQNALATGLTENSKLSEFVLEMREVTQQLALSAAEATRQQERLANELSKLSATSDAMGHPDANGSLFQRLFGNKH